MKKLRNILGVVTILLIAASLFMSYLNLTTTYTYLRKCLGSGVVALLGVLILGYGLIAKQSCIKFYAAMALGLTLACVGDLLIDRQFMLGAAAFAMGHICFGIAYCFLRPIKRLDWICSGALLAICVYLLVFAPFIVFDSTVLQVVCIVYGLIISFMLGKAIGNFIGEKNGVTLTLIVGSAVFFFSDLMLVMGQFAGGGKLASTLCLGTYYPALCLLALSAYFKTGEKA